MNEKLIEALQTALTRLTELSYRVPDALQYDDWVCIQTTLPEALSQSHQPVERGGAHGKNLADLMTLRLDDERQTLEVIAQRDRAEDLLTEVAEYLGCEEEWSSSHSHFDCIREAIESPQPVAPIGVELAEAEKVIDFEIRSHLGVPMDSIDVMVRHNLATAILEKLLALPQTEKGELWKLPLETINELALIVADRIMTCEAPDRTYFQDILESLRRTDAYSLEQVGWLSKVYKGGKLVDMITGKLLDDDEPVYRKTPQDAGKVKL